MILANVISANFLAHRRRCHAKNGVGVLRPANRHVQPSWPLVRKRGRLRDVVDPRAFIAFSPDRPGAADQPADCRDDLLVTLDCRARVARNDLGKQLGTLDRQASAALTRRRLSTISTPCTGRLSTFLIIQTWSIWPYVIATGRVLAGGGWAPGKLAPEPDRVDASGCLPRATKCFITVWNYRWVARLSAKWCMACRWQTPAMRCRAPWAGVR